jgi:putative flippase GtrA
LLAANTLAGTSAFLVGLLVMWLLVDSTGMPETPAAALSFLIANTLHYLLARKWVFDGSSRKLISGYGYFLANAAIGLVVTISLFSALMVWTSIHYLAARILVSMIAGLIIFVLNATLNFKRL